MKKFLTVLLVIAVMFTFSFGSAFAISSDEADALNAYKAQQAQNYYSTIEKAGENYFNGLTFDSYGYLTKTATSGFVTSYEGLVSKEIVKAAVDEAVDAAKTAFGAAVAQIVPSDSLNTNSAILDALQQAYVNVTTGSSGKITDTNILGTHLANVLEDQLKADKEAAATELAAYNPDLYSDDIDEYAIEINAVYGVDAIYGCGYSYAAAVGGQLGQVKLTAKEFVTKVKTAQSVEATAPTGADDAAKIQAVRKARRIAKEMILGHKITASEKYYIAPVKTLEDLKADTSVDAAKANAITQLKAALASKQIEMTNAIQDGIDNLSKYASLSDTNKKLLSDLNEAKADLAGQFADAEEVWTAQLNYKETTDAVKSHLNAILSVINRFGNETTGMPNTDAVATFETCADRVNAVDKLEADAAVLALQKDVNGQPYYDADVLKANLAKAIKTVYVDGTSYADAAELLAGGNEVALINAKIDYTNFITGKATSLTPKDSKGKTLTTKWNKVWALASGASGSIAVMAKGTIATGYAVDPYFMYDKAQRTALSELVTETKAAIKDAATIAEIEKIFAEANDKYEAIPTTKDHKDVWAATGSVGLAYKKADYDKELYAYAKYFEQKIERAKYPSAVQTAEGVMTEVVYPIVYKAYTVDELAEKVAEAKAAVDAIMSTAEVKAERAAVEAAIKALPATITLADVDAIMDAQDMLWDYEDIPGSNENPVTNKAVLEAAEIAYEKLAAKELDAAYKPLAAKKTITTADAEAIEALRDLYDDYDAFCEDYFPGNARTATTDEAKVIVLEGKLSDAKVAEAKALMIKLPANPTAKDRAAVEAARAAYEALTLAEKARVVGTLAYDNLIDAEEALEVLNVYAVQALKIKASTLPAKKGSITVKWTVSGDAAAADGFQVWKSTKKDSGYSKSFTTTKTTYKNTKGLKKGTRYYYKVRAYINVDGKNIYSDWSNKAHRIAK